MKAQRYRAANHRYVGAFYGHQRANLIREEIYKNGPVAVGMRVDEDFSFYSDGVYKSTLQKSPLKQEEEWERVDHGVVVVGWGKEVEQPFWKVQNSWGDEWGENGYFRIVMGTDESGIESMVEAADVVKDEHQGRRVAELFEQLGHGHNSKVREHNAKSGPS